jgi:hypothetical protein
LPWEDMTDYHREFMKAIEMANKEIEELKYKKEK